MKPNDNGEKIVKTITWSAGPAATAGAEFSCM